MTNETHADYKYLIEVLDKKHNKSEFKCGINALDNYLKTQAGQDIKKNVAITHVITAKNNERVLGFYSLSSIGIFPGELPENIIKKLPRYPVLPGLLLGILAVDEKHHGQGFGVHLLIDALKRSLAISNHVGIVAVIVDAKDEKAKSFYERNGFLALCGNINRLFLPLSTIKQLQL